MTAPKDKSKIKGKSNKPPCGSKKRNKDELCDSPFTYANGRCYLHNGGAKSGLESANISHGRYSKVLPVRLLAQFEASLKDPDLLDLKREIALLDARLAELFALVSQGETAGFLLDLQAQRTRALNARTANDSATQASALTEILRLIEAGADELRRYDEIHKVLEQRRRFVESETKRQLQLAQGVTLEQVGLFFHALTQAVKEETTPEQQARIMSKFDKLSPQHARGTLSLVS